MRRLIFNAGMIAVAVRRQALVAATAIAPIATMLSGRMRHNGIVQAQFAIVFVCKGPVAVFVVVIVIAAAFLVVLIIR